VALDFSPDPWLAQALDLAAQAVGASEPNPRVGCVIVDSRLQLLGQGFTQPAGQAHAEVMALRDAAACGRELRGATAVVTLEPCSHQGRTPPCCDALVAAGVARVVVALQDPNPLVAGQGMARLRAAGVEVLLLPAEHPAARASKDLNIGFFSRMLRARPWLRMKIAASLDGTTALDNGQSQWITGEAARADGHQWRKRAGAVLTGIGTVLEDDPRLDVRLAPTLRQPALVLVDSRLETPLDARLFSVAERALLVYAAADNVERARALQARGARIVHMPGPVIEGRSKVDLGAMLDDLAKQHQINELHVEAGHKLNGSLLREGLVDELLVYLAPCLLGVGRDMANLGPFGQLNQALRFEFTSFTQLGGDLRVLARRASPELPPLVPG
jgi:diaminohydroxyphosphoribosylaminopyrimidine deaminase/5-amino-6-(5-phosphoribosylamino)uracil reductase